MKSAFSGYIDELPFILVDNFENKHKSAYFLSHFHGDHIFGLNATDLPEKLEKNNGFIYGSAVTVAIVRSELPELEPYLKVLKLGSNTVTIKDNDDEIYLNVATLPAGHSLGSVMFLFKHEKTILYTGDFRITRNSIQKYSHLHKNGEPIHLDALYIDTTFQDVPSFPRRSEVVHNVAECIRDWLNEKSTHSVVVITSASYGYECICNEVFTVTGIKMYINERKWSVFSQFPNEMYGISNDKSSRVHLCTKWENDYPNSPEILFIYFSAMKWAQKITDDNYLNTINKNKIDACFATHCGRDELLHFIQYFRSNKIVGFPNDFKHDKRPVTFDGSNEENYLNFEISQRPKRSRSNSECEDLKLGNTVSKSDVKNLFDLVCNELA